MDGTSNFSFDFNTTQLKDWDRRHLWHPFTQMAEWMEEDPLVITQAEGCTLVDSEGRRYLDGVSSLWTNIHGHRRAEINTAICRQMEQVAHSTLLGLVNAPSTVLAKKLVEIAPGSLTRVFYSDAGATAVEIALKLATQYWQLRGQPERKQFVSLEGSYHGDTIGAMSVGYSETFHRHHRNLLFPCLRIPPPHVFRYYQNMSETVSLEASLQKARELFAEHGGTLAAVILEPLMQGAAGMWAQPAGFIREIRKLATEYGTLLIADEVATGFGRTGAMFACEHEHEKIAPDILCLGKGISGGYLPLAATLTTEEIFSAFLGEYTEYKTFFHGHTYTGNPLACAAGIASLEIFKKDRVLDSLQAKIELFTQFLTKQIVPLAHVADVRQKGFMVGIELAEDKATRRAYPPEQRIGKRVILRARAKGVILRPLGDVVILMPPLAVSHEELTLLVKVTREAVETVTEAE
ncbi:MAG: adenosylmethionine--8-amino-7-oxononanoate transaminase [Acidobacteria bacterium]|nr:adenosylmethionine--8-amino-7-oxononanoate transaminase [Acidobacteriota bacterium]